MSPRLYYLFEAINLVTSFINAGVLDNQSTGDNTLFYILFQIREAGPAGKGVFASRQFQAGEFLCRYEGNLVSAEEGHEADEKDDDTTQEYMAEQLRKDAKYNPDMDPQVRRSR